MSYALRHNPEKYGLVLAADGSAALPVFLKAMNAMHHFQPKLTEEGIREVMENADKQRFEISKGRIRALYGHSFPMQVEKTEAIPPDILYHGTANRFLNSIKEKGLLPMGRQYVHLSADVATALQVGLRRDHHPAPEDTLHPPARLPVEQHKAGQRRRRGFRRVRLLRPGHERIPRIA